MILNEMKRFLGENVDVFMIINLTAIRASLTKLESYALLYTFMHNIIPVAMIDSTFTHIAKNSP